MHADRVILLIDSYAFLAAIVDINNCFSFLIYHSM